MVELDPAIKLPLSEEELEELSADIRDRAYAMGVLIRPSRFQTVHGPLTLLPSPFPRRLYDKSMKLQTDINLLMLGISRDEEFLHSALKSVVPVDEFTRRLYEMHLQMKQEGVIKPVTLCINRTDYMLDCRTRGSDPGLDIDLSMVEINTIAAGCPALSTRLVDVHRYSLEQCGMSREKVQDRVPGSYGMEGVAEGMHATWRLYGEPTAVVVFVVRGEETNKFDQRWMEYGLKMKDDCVKVIRRTLRELGERGQLREDGRLFIDDMEVALLYFRTGYSPIDYPTETEWNARLMGERSRAAVCPSVAMQLAGTKKVQQILYEEGSIERFIEGRKRVNGLRSIFTGHYTLDLTPEGDEAAERAIANPSIYVMKPQREGGGNNLFGDNMKTALEKLRGCPERAAYMLMDRIISPLNQNYCMKYGNTDIQLMNVASEFGPFGTLVSHNNEIIFNKTTGYLYRTKDIRLDEGGLMVGTGFLDTPYLSGSELISPYVTQNGFGDHEH